MYIYVSGVNQRNKFGSTTLKNHAVTAQQILKY